MKLAMLVNQNFRTAAAKLAKQNLPLKTTFKLKGILKRIDEEYAKYEECRQDALVRFGEKDDSGNTKQDERGNVSFSAEGMQNFVKEIQELSQMDVEIGSVTVSELGENISMTTEEIMYLDGVIVE